MNPLKFPLMQFSEHYRRNSIKVKHRSLTNIILNTKVNTLSLNSFISCSGLLISPTSTCFLLFFIPYFPNSNCFLLIIANSSFLFLFFNIVYGRYVNGFASASAMVPVKKEAGGGDDLRVEKKGFLVSVV